MHQLGKAGPSVAAAIEDWGASGKLRRLWKADASLWTGADEDRWLGWLEVAARQGCGCQIGVYFATRVAALGQPHRRGGEHGVAAEEPVHR